MSESCPNKRENVSPFLLPARIEKNKTKAKKYSKKFNKLKN